MFGKKFSRIVNLNNYEEKLLEILQSGEKTVSEVSRISKIPRTSLYTTIDSLLKRNLILKKKDKNKTILSTVDKKYIDSILFTESTISKNQLDKEFLRIPDSKISYGISSLIKTYEKITNLKNQRVHVIQPTSSMLSSISKITPDKLVELNERVKKNHIIFDVIINKNYMNKYMDKYINENNFQMTQEKLLKSLEKRMADMSIIDNTYFNVSSEIYFTDQELYILNWEDEIALEIHNQEIILLIKELFMFTKSLSLKINYHELIEKHLSKVFEI